MAKKQSRKILKSHFLKKISYFEKAFLFLVFFLSPSQLSKHFWFPWSFVFGVRVDYLAFSLSLVDALIYFLFLVFVFRKFLEKNLQDLALKKVFPPFVVFFVLINILASVFPQNTFFYFLKLLPLFLLFFYLKSYKENFSDLFFFASSASLIFFGLIGVFQVVFGKTLGRLFWFLGERSFNINTTGIALFSLFGKDYLRAYSTFPHPNVLAGFFVVVIFLLLSVDHEKQERKKIVLLTLILSILPFILSFSLNAFAALLAVFAILLLKKKFDKKILLFLLNFVFLASLIFIFLPAKLNIYLRSNVLERIQLLSLAKGVFLQRPVFGVGLNNFIPSTVYWKDFPGPANYLLQPVHNIYVLVLSEAGLFGFVIFYFFLLKLVFLSFTKKNSWLLSALVFIMITGLFDHYWITLDQGRLAFVFLISFLFKRGDK